MDDYEHILPGIAQVNRFSFEASASICNRSNLSALTTSYALPGQVIQCPLFVRITISSLCGLPTPQATVQLGACEYVLYCRPTQVVYHLCTIIVTLISPNNVLNNLKLFIKKYTSVHSLCRVRGMLLNQGKGFNLTHVFGVTGYCG